MTSHGFWRSPLDPQRVMNAEVTRWQEQTPTPRSDALAVEEPLEIRVNGQSLATIMRTPGHDRELALGFLYTEGLLEPAGELPTLAEAADDDGLPLPNVLRVGLPTGAQDADAAFQRRFIVSASCGLCGRTSVDSLLATTPSLVDDAFRIPAARIYALPERLRAAQSVFAHTGGLHAAALFNADGDLWLLREDVGRHNAVDKLIGHGLLSGRLPYSRSLLLVSGRTSFEILQKALRAGIPCVAAISAPSSLAVELAERAGMTLIGFLRERSMNVYSHPARVIGS